MKVGLIQKKGGVGKSTLALNLAAAMALRDESVLLIDADPDSQTVTEWYRHRQAVGLPPVDHLTVIQQTTPDLHTKFKVTQEGKPSTFKHAVIDAPPRADAPLARSIIAACDIVLIPVGASLADLWAAETTVELIKQAQASGLKIKAAFVLSAIKHGTILARDFAEEIQNHGLPVLPAGTSYLTAYAAALSSCQTIFEYERASSKAYQEMLSILDAVKRLK